MNDYYRTGHNWEDIFDLLDVPKKLYKNGKIVVNYVGKVGMTKEFICGLPEHLYIILEKEVEDEKMRSYEYSRTVFIKNKSTHHYDVILNYIYDI